jgi:hypothetical protein
MPNIDLLTSLLQGVPAFIEWRLKHPDLKIDLVKADLSEAKLNGVQLSGADLSRACLVNADLRRADLSNAILMEANLHMANLSWADLSGTDLYGADLSNTKLTGANLHMANLRKAKLGGADFYDADLSGADLRATDLRETSLLNARLEGAKLILADIVNSNLELGPYATATLNMEKTGWEMYSNARNPASEAKYPWGNKYDSEKVASKVISYDTELFSPNANRILRVKFPLPDFVPLEEYLNDVTERLHSIELIYIIYLTIYAQLDQKIDISITFSDGHSQEFIGYKALGQYETAVSALRNIGVESVRLVSVHYGTAASFDLLGIGKILEILRDTVKDLAWRGKHEKQMAELEQKDKEAQIEHTRQETEKIAIETANQKIELLERVTSMPLDKSQKELIVSALIPNLQLLANKPVTPRFGSASKLPRLPEGTTKPIRRKS